MVDVLRIVRRACDVHRSMKKETILNGVYIERFHNSRNRWELDLPKSKGLLLTQPSEETG